MPRASFGSSAFAIAMEGQTLIVHRLKTELDDLRVAMLDGTPHSALSAFTTFLDSLESQRRDRDHDSWLEQSRVIREHEVFSFLMKCPMTKHSFEKPRGYPGDAALLDWIYFPESKVSELDDPVARFIYDYNVRRTAPSAVRSRARHIAQIIDEVPDGGSMLALACGHFREAECSVSIQQGRLSRIHVVDQDPLSLEIVRERNVPRLTSEEANVMKYPRATADSPRFDLVYAAGLFDYFSPRMAERVANRLWTHVAPGGVLCIPNFNENIPDAGYLECFMDWWLVYRTHAEMLQIGAALPPDSVASTLCELRDDENIWYLQARRKVAVPSQSAKLPNRTLRLDANAESPRPASGSPDLSTAQVRRSGNL